MRSSCNGGEGEMYGGGRKWSAEIGAQSSATDAAQAAHAPSSHVTRRVSGATSSRGHAGCVACCFYEHCNIAWSRWLRRMLFL